MLLALVLSYARGSNFKGKISKVFFEGAPLYSFMWLLLWRPRQPSIFLTPRTTDTSHPLGAPITSARTILLPELV